MTDIYLQIFYTTCTTLVPLIIPIIGLYVLINLIASLLYKG